MRTEPDAFALLKDKPALRAQCEFRVVFEIAKNHATRCFIERIEIIDNDCAWKSRSLQFLSQRFDKAVVVLLFYRLLVVECVYQLGNRSGFRISGVTRRYHLRCEPQ